MKVDLDGNLPINRYYVQMLCMIYFPGVKFSEENGGDDGLFLDVNVRKEGETVRARCTLTALEKTESAEKEAKIGGDITEDRAVKLAIGAAMLAVGDALLSYRPSWGMLIGVRPSKVAMEKLLEGNSKTRTRKILTSEFFVTPKKAALATDVALNERAIIGTPDKRDCSIYVPVALRVLFVCLIYVKEAAFPYSRISCPRLPRHRKDVRDDGKTRNERKNRLYRRRNAVRS